MTFVQPILFVAEALTSPVRKPIDTHWQSKSVGCWQLMRGAEIIELRKVQTVRALLLHLHYTPKTTDITTLMRKKYRVYDCQWREYADDGFPVNKLTD